jgi:ribosomal protein S18 acetylase RimI-like enzyme
VESKPFKVVISKAERGDLPQILALQKAAFLSEAEAINDFSIQPLTQTLTDIEADFDAGPILKAVESGRGKIAGSVRAYADADGAHIGKLVVHPDYQNNGIAKRLLQEIEAAFPAVGRFVLYTRVTSVKNIALYRKAGYREFGRERVSEKLEFAHMEKTESD